jgi:chromosome partitioning protein
MLSISVVNSKGGVGKTTIAASLAVHAAQEDGCKRRVAIVDLDPQKSLVEWWKRRGKPEGQPGHPTILEGVDSAFEAVERVDHSGLYDIVFLDGPPAFLTTMEEMIAAADFTLIPVKPSIVDLLATEDAVVLSRDAAAGYAVVFNDIAPNEKAAEKARSILFNNHIPICETEIQHRAAHVTAMNMGKSAAEVKSDKGAKSAAGNIAALWNEIRPLAMKAAKLRAKRKAVAHD